MRIIDKNHDFYDYLQDPTDNSIIFDRRGSYLLDKKRICEAIYQANYRRWSQHTDYSHSIVMLTCGAVTWYFLATVTKFQYLGLYDDRKKPEDFTLELLKVEKNYNRKSVLIRVLVSYCNGEKYNWKSKKYVFDKKNINLDECQERAVDITSLTTSIDTKDGFKEIKHDIPLLRGCGVANLVNPADVFYAIEEHFSRLKTEAERTEAIGTTNNDKIILHGFDTKTSFRGK